MLGLLMEMPMSPGAGTGACSCGPCGPAQNKSKGVSVFDRWVSSRTDLRVVIQSSTDGVSVIQSHSQSLSQIISQTSSQS